MEKIEKLDWVKVQLTRCCNLKCSFCSQADFRDASTIDADLFIKNVLEVAKPRLLIFTGGEPLAKYDTLKKLLEYCKEHNIETGIFSNCTLVTEEIAKELKSLNVAWVRFSINGYNSEIHELSYPIQTFDKIIKGVKILQKEGIYVKARTTVTKNNQNYIQELVELICSLGIKELDFRPYLELGDCNPHQDNSLSTDELISNCAKLINLKDLYKDKLQIKLLPNWFDFLYENQITDQKKYKVEVCNCGRKYIYIDASGNYRACAGHRLILGNIKDFKVDEIWLSCPFLKEVRNYKQDEFCQNCKFKIKCHQCNCHLINYEANGRFDKINPCCPLYNADKNDINNAYKIVEIKFKSCSENEKN